MSRDFFHGLLDGSLLSAPHQFHIAKCIVGITQIGWNAASEIERRKTLDLFVLAFDAFQAFNVLPPSALKKAAKADLSASAEHLISFPPHYGLSRWASLQACEKVIKAFLTCRGVSPRKTHDLASLAKEAKEAGLTALDDSQIADVLCKADVRYGEAHTSRGEALKAHYSTLAIVHRVSVQLPGRRAGT